MVEGEFIHRGNLIPKTALSSQKAALRESNFKRYGRRRIYTHRKFDSQNGPFEPESSFTGIKISRGMVEGYCIHIVILIPKTALLNQKEPLRESNFKRYGRRRVYTHRKVSFPKRPFRARKQLYGNQISRGMVEGECIHRESLIPKTALLSQKISRSMVEGEFIHRESFIPKTTLSSQKAALRESNFKRYGRRRMYTHRKFDSQNGPFEPESSFTGITCIIVYTLCFYHTSWNLIPFL